MDDRLSAEHLRFAQVGSIRTRYYDAGSGPNLVLIHGGQFGSYYSLDSWSLNLDGFAQAFRVVAFDKLGQGHTDNPPDMSGYRFSAVVDHACALLETVGIRQAHLVGHSMGALAALIIALARPRLVQSLTLVDSNTAAPDDPAHPRGVFYEELERAAPPDATLLERVRREPEAQSWSTTHVTADFAHRMLEIAKSERNHVAAAAFATVRKSFNEELAELRRSTIARIDSYGLPTPALVLWGRDDPSAPVPLAVQLFDLIAARGSAAELHVLNRAGHYCFRERPAAFERVVSSFCQQCAD